MHFRVEYWHSVDLLDEAVYYCAPARKKRKHQQVDEEQEEAQQQSSNPSTPISPIQVNISPAVRAFRAQREEEEKERIERDDLGESATNFVREWVEQWRDLCGLLRNIQHVLPSSHCPIVVPKLRDRSVIQRVYKFWRMQLHPDTLNRKNPTILEQKILRLAFIALGEAYENYFSNS